MNFGATLRIAREAHGWTQPQLAREIYDASGGLIDLSPAEISRYERGRVLSPRLDVVRAVAKATGHPIEFFTGSEEVAPQGATFRGPRASAARRGAADGQAGAGAGDDDPREGGDVTGAAA